jgi:predicted DNA-binding protein with PD1-like motif
LKTKKWKEIDSGARRSFAVVFDSGDEAFAGLSAFARDRRLSAAQITAIGAFEKAVLGYFDWQRKDYVRIPVNEQVEVVSLIGDVALGPDGDPKLHAHVVLGRRDGVALGGHLLEGRVRPTLEVVVVESPAHLRKKHDPETGLALIRL